MATDAKKKRIQIMEQQDAEGISRKRWKHTLNPNIFILIKTILIILIPIIYFVYSPILILVMVSYVGVYFLARMAEHSLNKSVIRANHIHIFKFDSAIALIIIVISIFGVCLSTTNKTKDSVFEKMDSTEISEVVGKQDFKGAQKSSTFNSFITSLKNLGSLLTGERNVFITYSNKNNFHFGTIDAPEDFVKDFSEIDDGELSNESEEFEKRGGKLGKDIDFSIDDLPLEYMSSSILSTINTVLIFLVSVVGVISILFIIIKKHKFNKDMNEVVLEGTITMLDASELERILSFEEEKKEVKT